MLLAAGTARRSDFADLDVPDWAWPALLAVLAVMLAVDLLRHRDDHAPTTGEALWESITWVACALLFAGVVAVAFGRQAFGEYISGYLIEKSLSIDNVFVWALLLTTMAIPLRLQHRVLFWGVFGALAPAGRLHLRGFGAHRPILVAACRVRRLSGVHRRQGDPSPRRSGWPPTIRGDEPAASGHAGQLRARREPLPDPPAAAAGRPRRFSPPWS